VNVLYAAFHQSLTPVPEGSEGTPSPSPLLLTEDRRSRGAKNWPPGGGPRRRTIGGPPGRLFTAFLL
jgi:hypothetical protein